MGGTYVQGDNNLPATGTLLRQFEEGQAYFRDEFGRSTDTAWFPDSFGHSAGLPEILAANGITNFAHCRPFKSTLPLTEPAYWWEGAGRHSDRSRAKEDPATNRDSGDRFERGRYGSRWRPWRGVWSRIKACG